MEIRQETSLGKLERQYCVFGDNYRHLISFLADGGEESDDLKSNGRTRKFLYFGARVKVAYIKGGPERSPQVKISVSSDSNTRTLFVYNTLVGIILDTNPRKPKKAA